MFTIAVQSSGAATKAVQLDRDCVFVGALGSGKTLISQDPSQTATGFEGGSDKVAYNYIWYRGAATVTNTVPAIRFSISAGETIFVNFSAAAGVIMYFDDMVS
jgi:hypothetical protein